MEGLLDTVALNLVCKVWGEITSGEEVREVCIRRGQLQVQRP